MIIEDIPIEFQPKYRSTYPEYSDGYHIEENMYKYFQSIKDQISTHFIYLPVFWTSYYIMNGYGDKIDKLYEWLQTLDPNKQYFSVIQFAAGLFIREPIPNLLLFSTGGGMNCKKTCYRTEQYYGIERVIFHGTPTKYNIPLLCSPSFPCDNLRKHIFCSFIGRYDTHACRFVMRDALQRYNDIVFVDSAGFDRYRELLNTSVFTLAPRGHGYTSFRLFEAIAAGSIPVYIWEKHKILPYEDEIDWNEFSIVIHTTELDTLYSRMKNCNVGKMQSALRKVAPLFTYHGCIQYMKRILISNPSIL